jgi:hypothetical protein
MASKHWYVLGFTGDDVVGGWQDSRLATECAKAWEAAGCPEDFRILQGAGEGLYFSYWYLDEASARVLDAQQVHWRLFLIGEQPLPPPGAVRAVKTGERGRHS